MQHVMHLKSLRATSFCFGMVASNIGEASQEGSLVKLPIFPRTDADRLSRHFLHHATQPKRKIFYSP